MIALRRMSLLLVCTLAAMTPLLVTAQEGPVTSRPAPSTRASAVAGYEPLERYESRQIEGWTVLINKGILEQETLGPAVLREMESQLYLASRHLPPKAVEKLKGVKIWVELNDRGFPGGVYHPNAQWLRSHGYNPAKAKCVEIGNARNLLTWTLEQPYMVMHELAHAYHDQVLGYDNPGIAAAYQEAVASKRYDAVLRANGQTVRHYGLNNDQEFFAEMSEAFFGANDFYPFVRAELKTSDPKTYTAIAEAWNVRP